MAYTTAQLVDAYTKANLGKGPDQATTLTLDAYATQTLPGGSKTEAQALADTLKLVNPTTAVAVETYQFFTGRAPTTAGLTYLVNSTANTSDLNDAYYSKFSQENRFINFSINLATGQGEGATAFAALYGGTSVSYAQVVASAYDKVIGNAAATAAGVDVSAAVTFLSRQANIDYLTAFVKANTGYTSASDIDLAVKAALIGEVLNAATVSGIGIYARATNALLVDLSDGVLSAETTNGTNILTAYPGAGIPGQSFVLTAGVDTLTGTTGDDTFTGTGTTLTSLDSINGGAGTDSLIIQDPTASLGGGLAPSLTLTSIEKVTVNTSGSLGQFTVAATGPTSAVPEVRSVNPTIVNPTSGATLTVTYNGVSFTTAAMDGTPTTAEVQVLIRDAINTIAGSTVATIVSGTLYVSATAGNSVPAISVVAGTPGDVTVTTTQTQAPAAATTGSAGTTAAVFDLSGQAGVTDFVGTASGAANVKVANTTNVTLTNAGNGAVKVEGGKAVAVTTGTGNVTVDGASGLASVSVTGGGTVTVDDVTTASAGTLTSVSLNKLGGTANLTGDALTSLTLGGANAATQNVNITNNTLKHTLTINGAGAGYDSTGAAQTVTVADANAETVALNTSAKSNFQLNVGAVLKTVTASGSGALALNLNSGTNTAVTSFDGSAATGGITLTNVAAGTTSIKTGAGNDSFTTTQTTKATYDTGAGNDTVTVGSALVAGTTISLGAGNDKLLAAVGGSIANTSGTDVTVVDGGDGTDTLALELVGSANIAVFKNFEIFDTVSMTTGKTLDLDILTAGNTVTGLTGSGAFNGNGTVTLTNIGAGVGYSQNGAFDSVGDTLALTQKTAGALTITLNADSTSTTAANNKGLVAVATNATSLKAVFDVDSAYTAGANTETLALTGSKATTLEVVSGGANATNVLNYTTADDGTGAGLLTSATITGTKAITFDAIYGANTVSLTSVDASGLSGGLKFDLGDLKTSATFSSVVKLGGGDDVLTAANGVGVQGIHLGTAEDATSTTGLDIILSTGAAQAADATNASWTLKDGLLTFLGAGPTTLTAATALADAAAVGAGASVVFQYVNDSYVFIQGGGSDTVIKLVGTTGLHGVDNVATGQLYVF